MDSAGQTEFSKAVPAFGGLGKNYWEVVCSKGVLNVITFVDWCCLLGEKNQGILNELIDHVESQRAVFHDEIIGFFMEVNGKLKQRPPFQFVDRIIEYTPKEYAKGIKNVTVNEPYFSGHFPDAPVMPGVLLIECCAQMCAVCLDLGENEDPTKINVMLKADGFRFLRDCFDVPIVKAE